MANSTDSATTGRTPRAGNATETERSDTVIFRNSRFLLAAIFAASLVDLLFSVFLLLFLAIGTLILFGIDSKQLFYASAWTFAALAIGFPGLRLWMWARTMTHNEARMDGRGVEFHLGSGKRTEAGFVAWDQIASITKRQTLKGTVFTVSGTGGREAKFSTRTFFRAKSLARLISSRSGMPILEG